MGKTKSTIEANAGAHEAEQAQLLEQLEATADNADLALATLVGDVRDTLIDIIKTRPKPWTALSAGEQQDVARTLEYCAKEVIKKVVELVREDGLEHPPIRAILEGYSEKDGVKATLKIKGGSEEESEQAIIGLHKVRGKLVLIIPASADDYGGQRKDVEIIPDEQAFEFEAGSDVVEAPADNSDLAGVTAEDVAAAEAAVTGAKQAGEELTAEEAAIQAQREADAAAFDAGKE